MRNVAVPIISAILLAGCTGGANDSVPGDTSETDAYAGIGEESALRLIGTEPFWGISIESGSMTYTTPENVEGVVIEVERFAGRGGVSFSGELEGAAVDVAVTPGECSDGMSDHTYPFTATVQIGDEQLTGCAWRDGEDDIGDGDSSTTDIA